MPRSRCSPSYLKHLERTKPLRARTCFQPELRSLASTRFRVNCFEFVTWDNFDVSRSPFIFPIKCVELHDDCQLLISRFVTVQSAWLDAAVHPICPIRGIYRTIHLKTYFTHMLRAWAWEKRQWRCWEKTKTKNPKPWQSVTYHNLYRSLARAKVVKRITRDVSRAFCGLCEWPVSGNPLMGIWWGCRDATANMNRGGDGSVVEWFFSGNISEGTRHSFMDGRSISLLFPLLSQHALGRIFVLNLWHADV